MKTRQIVLIIISAITLLLSTRIANIIVTITENEWYNNEFVFHCFDYSLSIKIIALILFACSFIKSDDKYTM